MSAAPVAPAAMPEVGRVAPAFALRATPDQVVRLSDFRGRPVLLVFYPADWSPVCGDEMALFNAVHPEFQRLGAEIVGISVDGPWCHVAFAESRHLHFALLSDFEPKGAAARAYGMYREADGTAARGLVLVDAAGIVRWRAVSPVGVNPGADGALAALEALVPPAPDGAVASDGPTATPAPVAATTA